MTPDIASAPLLALDEALRRLAAGCAPVPARNLALGSALGGFAGRDLAGVQDVPPSRLAWRDGWAVAGAGVTGASDYAPVLPARPPDWVEAGAALPAGTDTVLPPEAVVGGEIVADAPFHDGTRAPGEDLRAGDPAVWAGERLGVGHLLALEAAGYAAVPARVPRLRLVATGAATGHEALAALARADGAAVTPARVPDDAEAIAAAIADGEADAVLVLGGTGFGRTDRSVAGLARAGHVAVRGIALRPAETAAFGTAGGRPVLLLPGRPDAWLAAWLVLGRALLRGLAGAPAPPCVRQRLARRLGSTIGLSEIVYAQPTERGLEPLGGMGIPLVCLARARAAILVPPEREGYPEGAEVEVMAL